jgi:hypothetical protein
MSPVSERSKLRSPLPAHCWCTSTASVFVPFTNAEVGMVKLKNWFSAAPSTLVDANVVFVIVPAGMFERTTSVPFRYTTAPSSRLRPSVTGAPSSAVFTLNW